MYRIRSSIKIPCKHSNPKTETKTPPTPTRSQVYPIQSHQTHLPPHPLLPRLNSNNRPARSRERNRSLHSKQIKLLSPTTPIGQIRTRLDDSIRRIRAPAARTPICAGVAAVQTAHGGSLEVEAGAGVAFAVVLDEDVGEFGGGGFCGADGVGGGEAELRGHGGVGHEEGQGVAGGDVGVAADGVVAGCGCEGLDGGGVGVGGGDGCGYRGYYCCCC